MKQLQTTKVTKHDTKVPKPYPQGICAKGPQEFIRGLRVTFVAFVIVTV